MPSGSVTRRVEEQGGFDDEISGKQKGISNRVSSLFVKAWNTFTLIYITLFFHAYTAYNKFLSDIFCAKLEIFVNVFFTLNRN